MMLISPLDRIRRLAKPMSPIDSGASSQLASFDGIRAVLFDVYGTLIISGSGDVGVAIEQARGDAFIEALRAVGQTDAAKTVDGDRAVATLHDVIAAHQAHRRTEGVAYPEVDIRRVWVDVLRSLDGPDLSPAMIDCLAVEYECRVNPTWPMPDILQALTELHRRGVALGIVSNAQFFTPLLFDALTDRDLAGLGFNPALCIYSYELLEAKPSTRLYELAADRLNEQHRIAPPETLYIGNDMLNDITPAAAVGFRTALFAGDRRSLRRREGDDRIRNVTPDAVITALAQLPPLLSCAV